MRVAVVGAGSWGTAVAALCSVNADVVLWARRPELAACVSARHENPDYLAGHRAAATLSAPLPTSPRRARTPTCS